MAAVSLTPADLEPFATIPEAKALLMIEDALALAARVAPCINDPEFSFAAAAKAVIRGAILRWNDAGSGALTSEQLEDYRYVTDSRQPRRGMFWPSEIEQLQDLCRTGGPSGAYSFDTIASATTVHADICALNFGAQYCSCGAVLTQNLALYENVV